MTLVDRTPTTSAAVLAAVRALAPTLAERAAEIEAARRVPPDLLDRLVAAGCFRLLLPPSHGGLGADLPAALRVFEALARADASVGWTAMIGAGAWVDLAELPRETFDELFRGDRDVIVAGVFNPTGQIAAADGGYRVSGRWSFASGCEHADWLWGNCLEGLVDGVPQLRGAVFAPDEVVIEDTWTVSGLCGTGSHHFHVTDVDLPAERTFRVDLDDPHPCIDAAIVRIPVPPLLAAAIAGVALGIAQGALDDVVELAAGKVPLLAAAPLAADPVFELDLATADTELRAARALLYETAEALWAAGEAGEELALPERARARAAAVWATERAAAVVDAAYRAGGGTALYADCPLQRRLRDVRALTQHFLVKRGTLVTAGALLAGHDVPLGVF
ncbi:MAG TPA: acyl-CoA dehydrogenase family protein [Acidimicrobiales bacterium]